jgi:hypothetical protein
MAVLYITEYADVARPQAPAGIPSWPQEPPLAEQTVAIGAGSVASAAFNAATRFVRLQSDVVCSVEFGTAPTATATTGRLPANVIDVRGVPMGAGFKVAVITNT